LSWALLLTLVVALGIALFALASRRSELARMARTVQERERVTREGGAKARLQQPVVDLSRCLGCGTCVAACPEEGVLELVHGQAMVVRGARCVGHAACERECPVGAITVTLADLAERRDVPVLTEGLEAADSPGLFLAGEVTARALIKTAIEHGAAVGSEVARRVQGAEARPGVLDLCIVGAGPAGIACSLEAKRNGLAFVTLEQERGAGGTVAKYPRRKLVMTQPVELPVYGRFSRTSFTKEELMQLWNEMIAEQELPIRGGETFEGCERAEDGTWIVHSTSGDWSARNVCLAVGRRGTPNKLGVPGEDLPKVAYSLLDAQSYQGRRILVVGGGDSAVEAALGLAEQPGNEVWLSYRREAFFRIRSRNEERLFQAVADGRLKLLLSSRVLAIHPDAVELELLENGAARHVRLLNDEVFVLAGGQPPVPLLERSGVSFDPARRGAADPLYEQGTGLYRALVVGFLLAVATLVWALWNSDYYRLPRAERPMHAKHELLRPGMGLGLWMGIGASALIGLNLLYLARRAPGSRLRFGSLQTWMTSHVATGILAFLFVVLHGAMQPRETVGGHAFWALGVLLVTGAVGRYFYAVVPRAANGRELELAEVKGRLERMSEEWDQGQQRFRDRVRTELDELLRRRQWRGSFLGRLLALLGVRRDLRRFLEFVEREGRAEGVDEEQIRETRGLVERAHRTALATAHYEDLRAILGTWRWLHRWVAALMVLLVVVHVVYALSYGAHLFDGGDA